MSLVASPCTSIETRSWPGSSSALLPESREVLHALHQLVEALLVRFDHATRLGDREDDVGPAGELAAVFEREVEQGREHSSRELDRHRLDPVEGLAFGERLEDVDRPLADERLDILQILRLHRRGDRPALRALFGWIHGDERRRLGPGCGTFRGRRRPA